MKIFKTRNWISVDFLNSLIWHGIGPTLAYTVKWSDTVDFIPVGHVWTPLVDFKPEHFFAGLSITRLREWFKASSSFKHTCKLCKFSFKKLMSEKSAKTHLLSVHSCLERNICLTNYDLIIDFSLSNMAPRWRNLLPVSQRALINCRQLMKRAPGTPVRA